MIHIDISDVSTEKELIDVCVQNKWDKKPDAFVKHSTKCFDYLEHVGAVKFEKWYKMSKNIQRRNVWMCTVAQLSEVTGIAVGNRLNILLREFSNVGLCVVEYPEGKYDGRSSVSERRRVIFNPHLVWKGCLGKQYQYKKEWDVSRYGYVLNKE
ncbi:hypothetical protein Barba10S_gp056 [Rheinheimera phage vB_RspM_Barba10S]|uniref:Uncharacterized protein n=2 Tax=Barbavirus barba18A TaxID=2734090 RepID=A0A4P8NDS4_9CAUD|nr:hypothetical protein Barba10S_gp056 [Rheinheimera phage vB_RspM_Barba10S]QCQ64369.1 hypothetical protein Barba29S_gp054 [Rheinheimera phage vB_RspM_Barba29S]